MDAGEVLRAVRRREGWSQRALAARSGVAASTIAAVEAGRRSPSLSVMSAVLAAAGLELAVDAVPPALGGAAVQHLHRSLSARLHLACGGSGRPDLHLHVPAWAALETLATRHSVHLHGRTALALWLPLGSTDPVVVCARANGLWSSLPSEYDTSLVDIRPDCAGHPGLPVVVRLGRGRVTADPPARMALDTEHAQQRAVLRAVARLLDERAPADAAGRRPRAHRDPDHAAERDRVFHTKRWRLHEMPSATDVRSWRLDDDASLVAWLRRAGYPV